MDSKYEFSILGPPLDHDLQATIFEQKYEKYSRSFKFKLGTHGNEPWASREGRFGYKNKHYKTKIIES